MHPDFDVGDARSRQRLAAFLAELPWGWPAADDPNHPRAQAVTRRAEAPPLAPGEALLLTERLGEGSLWALRLRGATRGDVALDADDVWRRAAELVPATLSMLWQSPRLRDPRTESDSFRPLASSPPRLRRAHAPIRAQEGGPQTPFESVVAGDSLGVALLLAQASLLAETPLPADIAATATLDPSGQLGPVGGLEAKFRALLRLAPRVRRLIVAHQQRIDAERVLERIAPIEGASALTVVGLASAREAVRFALPDEVIEEAWRQTGADLDRRRRQVERLLQLALTDRSESADWRPIEHAASAAVDGWSDLLGHERWSLEFAAAVAARHMGRAAERPLQLPAQEAVVAIPQPRRARILAHLVQQSADTGEPSPESVEAMTPTHAVRGPDAFPDHIKLTGALGRLASARRRHTDALALQRESAEAWLARPDFHEEVSYPLSEMFRLAVTLEDPAALDEAEQLLARAIRAGAIPEGSAWIEAPRARALVALGRPRADALRALEPLLGSEAPAHCGHVARRARRALAVRDGEPRVIQQIDADLAQALDAARREVASASTAIDRRRAEDRVRAVDTCLALVELDALSEGEESSERAERLRALQPALCSVLLLGVAREQWVRILRQCFPY